jgi:ABC-type Fe3+/spermidine/putrescine transport system ATPase subunit
VEDGGARFVAGEVGVAVRADGVPPGAATLAIRPHRLRIVDPGTGALPGVCRRSAYLGSRIEYVVATPWGELLVFDGEARTPRARDEPVGVAFDADAAIVLGR